jgi:hypothetical protein
MSQKSRAPYILRLERLDSEFPPNIEPLFPELITREQPVLWK